MLKVKFRRKFVTSCAACRLCCINTDPGRESSRQKVVNFHEDLCSLPFSSNSLIEFQSDYAKLGSTSFQNCNLDEKALDLVSLHIDIVLNEQSRRRVLFEKDLELEKVIFMRKNTIKNYCQTIELVA